MPVSIYVAASSSEIERAKTIMAKLRAAGFEVISKWAENIEHVGQSNPRDATVEQRQQWSVDDVRAACNSQLFWLLMPIGPHSFGATFEFAFFCALKQSADSFVSGDYLRSIFTSFSNCFDSDEAAFEAIVAHAKTFPPDCSCDAKPEPVEGATGIYTTWHTPECAITAWRLARERATAAAERTMARNENAAEPEG